MIPNINTRGQSFKGVTEYLLHDVEKIQPENGKEYHVHLDSSERVGFTETANMHTDDIEQAARFMAWSDMHRDDLRESNAGRKGTAGNVYHYSLSWHPDENPDQKHMSAMAHASVEHLGLSDHQYYMVEHTDEPHKHVHVVVNLAHHETGKIANVYRDQYAMDKWAHDYELKHEIVCHDRDKKFQDLEAGKRTYESDLSKAERKQQFAQSASEIYRSSDSGKAFTAGLEQEGLTIAQGHRGRLVVVDDQGEVYRLTGLINGVKVKDIEQRFNDLDRTALPHADDLESERKAAFDEWLAAQEMIKDIIKDELEEERNKAHDIKSQQETTDKALSMDRDTLHDLSLRDGDSLQGEGRGELPNVLSSDEERRYAEYLGMQPLSRSGRSGSRSHGTSESPSGEIQDNARNPESSTDQETARQHALNNAADRHAEQQIALEELAAKYEKQARIEILQQAKIDWADLKERQQVQRDERERILRSTDSAEEAASRKYYKAQIRDSLNEKREVEQHNASWLSRGIFRWRNGVSVYDELDNIQRSIDDAKTKLEANTGGLTRDDFRELEALRRQQAETREALKDRIDKELEEAKEQSKQKAIDERNAALIKEAQTSHEAAERLADQVQAKSKSQAADIGAIKEKAANHRTEQEQQKQAAQQEAADMLKQKPDTTGKTSRQQWEEAVTLDSAMQQGGDWNTERKEEPQPDLEPEPLSSEQIAQQHYEQALRDGLSDSHSQEISISHDEDGGLSR